MKAVKMMSLMMTLALTLFVSACSSDDDDTLRGVSQAELVGKWAQVPADANLIMDGGLTWEFRADNTSECRSYDVFSGETLTIAYTYQLENGGTLITLTNVDDNTIQSYFIGKLSADEIAWNLPQGGHAMKLIKK